MKVCDVRYHREVPTPQPKSVNFENSPPVAAAIGRSEYILHLTNEVFSTFTHGQRQLNIILKKVRGANCCLRLHFFIENTTYTSLR